MFIVLVTILFLFIGFNVTVGLSGMLTSLSED